MWKHGILRSYRRKLKKWRWLMMSFSLLYPESRSYLYLKLWRSCACAAQTQGDEDRKDNRMKSEVNSFWRFVLIIGHITKLFPTGVTSFSRVMSSKNIYFFSKINVQACMCTFKILPYKGTMQLCSIYGSTTWL